MAPTSVPTVSFQSISLLRDEDLVFLPFFFFKSLCSFLHVPLSINLASLDLSFINARLAATNTNCLSSLQQRIHWKDTNPTGSFTSFTPSTFSSWIPQPRKPLWPCWVLYAPTVFCTVRSPASGRQGSVPGISSVCVWSWNSINVCCTHKWIIKKINSCSWPQWWILIIVNPNVLAYGVPFLSSQFLSISHTFILPWSLWQQSKFSIGTWYCFIYQYYGVLSFLWTHCYLVRWILN